VGCGACVCLQGCERSVITYSSLISACEKSGEWQLALRFFDECLKDNCRPNVITFNSLITACAQGGAPFPFCHFLSAITFCHGSCPVCRVHDKHWRELQKHKAERRNAIAMPFFVDCCWKKALLVLVCGTTRAMRPLVTKIYVKRRSRTPEACACGVMQGRSGRRRGSCLS
jgi:pentatricopeptide repeat protein